MTQRKLLDLATPRAAFEHAIDSHEQVLGEFFLAKFLGFRVTYGHENQHETCIVEFDAHEFLQNPGGAVQGGVIATALDVSMGHLIQHLQGSAATVDLSVQYLRAVKQGRVRCTARVTHRGARLWFMNAVATDESDEKLATATATFALAKT